MKATPEEIAHYEQLAIERGGSAGRAIDAGVPTFAGNGIKDRTLAGPATANISEADFQLAVIDLAHRLGWKVAHFRKARTKDGWRTAVAADGKGFTDLVLARDRIVWAEIKVPPNKLTPDQENWRDWLLAAGQEWYCWMPADIEEIERVLR